MQLYSLFWVHTTNDTDGVFGRTRLFSTIIKKKDKIYEHLDSLFHVIRDRLLCAAWGSDG